MSSVPAQPTPAPPHAERRAHLRKRLDQLAYIGFGPDTGGVLLDISEEGLRCQIVGAVIKGDHCHLKFALPGRHSAIEADGQVVWSNQSRQGGGVRLVGLGPDAKLQLQQWLNDQIASDGARRAAPIPTRSKSVGAVHVPRPSVPEFTVPAPAATMSAAQSDVVVPGGPHSPIHLEFHAAAQTQQPAQEMAGVGTEKAVSPAAIAETVTPPIEMPPPAQTAPAAVAETQSVNVAAEAARPHIAATQEPASASPMVVKLQLAELRNPRFTKTAVLSGCVAAGIVALALTAFDPVRVFLGDEASLQIAIPTPPAPPVRTEGLSQPALSLPAESKPAVTGDAADRSSNTSAPNTVSASNRPSRDPSTAAPANRQQLRMALPLPRASNPAASAAAVPDIPAAPMVLPAAPLMEVPALVGSLSDAPQPTNPSAGAEYRPPEVLSRVEPVYSTMARQSRLQGTVRVNATIGVDGVPYSLVCVGGNSVLCQMAFQAIAKWRFQPATSNGQPVTAQTLISFNFQLR